MGYRMTTTMRSKVNASLVQREHIPITLPTVQMLEAARKEEADERD